MEGETPLDDLSGLTVKIPNISRRQLNEAEAENIAKATFKYLVKSGGVQRLEFTPEVMAKIHKEMFSDVWLWAGQYRTTKTNIGSAPSAIYQDLIILSQDLKSWDDFQIDILEQSVRLHHRAVQIHPFLNGNGRWSRMLGNLWLKKHKSPLVYWPSDVEVLTKVRKEYLKALKEADDMNYAPLVELHKRYQKL